MRGFKLIFPLSALLISTTAFAAVTDISNQVLTSQIAVKPNMIFLLDDSSSMDSEVLMNTNDGALWWDGLSTVRSFTSGGVPLYNSNGVAGADGTHTWYKYVYLFPNGSTSDARINLDATNDHFAIPPIPAYAFVRSSDYNPMYYNPNINYTSWVQAYISGATQTFANATPTAARSHPVFPTSGSPVTLDLTNNFTSSSSNWAATNWTYRMLPGMVIPGLTIAGITGRKNGSGSFSSIITNYTITTADNYWDVAIPYYPATYYMKLSSLSASDPCQLDLTRQVTAPDGVTLCKFEIKSTSAYPYPTGRSYTDEMQNFANWYTYFRKRKLMLSGALGNVLSQVNNMRGGYLRMNGLSTVTMLDFSSSSASTNWQALLGQVYQNPAASGTPTRDALAYAGNQFKTNTNIIQYGCQVNATLVMTDGFANVTTPSVPSYTPATWVGTTPYTTTYPTTLADIAAAYYTINLRTDLPAGIVPVDTTNTSPSADRNTNLHMITYGLGLGVNGTIFGTGSAQATAPYTNPPTWPNPNVDRNPTAVDDLWHATLNSRGLLFNATDANLASSFLEDLVADLLIKAGANSAVSISNVNVSATNNIAYSASFTGNYGDLMPITINITTGVVTPASPGWSAQDLLDARTSANRYIATYTGSAGVAFQWASLPSSMQTLLNSAVTPPGPSDGQFVLNYLRGDRTKEGISYRPRLHLLGDIVDPSPVYVGGAMANYIDTGYATFAAGLVSRTPMIYQGANDGMLHAFNASTGAEVWAYVPSFVYSNLSAFASKTYSHRYYVDGVPVVGDVYTGSAWRTLLVGGLRGGGNGYYALDVTSPSAVSESAAASKVLWEFPNSSTSSTVRNNVGLSFGQPIIAKTAANSGQWVVLVTSGYNNTSGDGQGHLFVLNANTGALIADLTTGVGTAASPSGLAQISAFAKNSKNDATIDYVYGGDLNGNVWRFDLSSSNTASWNVRKLATLVDASGNVQPITVAPELLQTNSRRMVYVGTGKLLGLTDLTTTGTQSMYGLLDNMTTNPTITPLRSSLKQQTISGNVISNTAINYTTYKGWYFDLPTSGERLALNPAIALGLLVFNSAIPNATACSSASYEYVVDPNTGGQIPGAMFNGVLASRVALTSGLASQPIIVELTSNGQVVALTHNSNNTISSVSLPVSAASTSVKNVAWKEILGN